jgi:hypothetical protein
LRITKKNYKERINCLKQLIKVFIGDASVLDDFDRAMVEINKSDDELM